MIRSARPFNAVLVALVAAGIPWCVFGGVARAATGAVPERGEAEGAIAALAVNTPSQGLGQSESPEPSSEASSELALTPGPEPGAAATAPAIADRPIPSDIPDAVNVAEVDSAEMAAPAAAIAAPGEGDARDDLTILVPELTGAAPNRDRWIAQAATGGTCVNELGNALNAIARSQGGRWGMRVETLDDGRVFHQVGADQGLIPASNAKLFVTAAALQMYAPETKVQNSSLSSWITTINQRSQNDLADRLFRLIGGQPAVQRALTPLGVDASGYRLADGSGLSRSSTLKANAAIALLRGMSRDRNGTLFRDSLPVSGVSGTLVNRFKGTAAQGRVFAKTGTLRGVRALSGYMAHPLYGSLVFSILANHPSQQGDGLRSAIDRMVLTVMQMRPCDAEAIDPLNLRPGYPSRLPSVFEEFRQRQEERRRQQREAQPR